jgi:hypothetical protein
MFVNVGVNIPLANSPTYRILNDLPLPSLYTATARNYAIIARKPPRPVNIGGQGVKIKGF